MKIKFLKINILLILLIISGLEIKAAESDSEEDISDLDTVVVTATKTSEKVKNLPVHVDVITDRQIKESGATTVAEILATKVNGHAHKYGGITQSVGLRGFRSETHGDDIRGRVLILIDGHRVGTGNAAKIPAEIIERIEIIKGPASALYGSAAMGGVINIITREGKGEIETTVKTEYGSFNYKKIGVSSSGGISDWIGYFITGNYTSMSDYESVDYGKIYNSEIKDANIGGNINLFPSENQEIRLGFLYSNLEAETPAWLNYPKYTEYDQDKKDYADKSRGNIDLEYNHMFLNNNLHYKAVGYYLWDKNEWYFGDTSGGGAVEDSYTKYIDTTIGVDQQFTAKLIPYNKIIFGYTFELLEKKASAEEAGMELIPFTPGLEYKTNSFYLQDVVNLFGNQLNLVFGLRYDRFNLKAKEAETGTYIGFNEKSENYYHWSPKAGISYRINNIFKLRTNLGQGFKTPSPDQLSAEYEYDAGYGPTRILGNPDLKPETSIAYDAGFDLTPENINFGFTYSYTKTKDLIVQAAEIVEYNGENWTTFENSGKTRMQAIDTNFHILMGKMLKLPVGIELITNFTKNLEYVDRDNDDEKLNYISNYECRSNLRLSYKMVVINLSYIYIGKQNFQNWDNLDANYNPTIEEKDSFYFFNLNLRILIGKYLELTGSVDNLTNKDYEWVQGYPMPERNYKLGVVGKF